METFVEMPSPLWWGHFFKSVPNPGTSSRMSVWYSQTAHFLVLQSCTPTCPSDPRPLGLGKTQCQRKTWVEGPNPNVVSEEIVWSQVRINQQSLALLRDLPYINLRNSAEFISWLIRYYYQITFARKKKNLVVRRRIFLTQVSQFWLFSISPLWEKEIS